MASTPLDSADPEETSATDSLVSKTVVAPGPRVSGDSVTVRDVVESAAAQSAVVPVLD